MTKQERAIKMIRKKIVKNTDDLFAELDVLRIMDHPNIIKLFEIFDYKDFYYVVTEYCSGGELFEFLQRSSRITEKTVAIIMKQLLSAVNYMHKKNIMHRDLKP
jgi:calcium-dependent protein kinase